MWVVVDSNLVFCTLQFITPLQHFFLKIICIVHDRHNCQLSTQEEWWILTLLKMKIAVWASGCMCTTYIWSICLHIKCMSKNISGYGKGEQTITDMYSMHTIRAFCVKVSFKKYSLSKQSNKTHPLSVKTTKSHSLKHIFNTLLELNST